MFGFIQHKEIVTIKENEKRVVIVRLVVCTRLRDMCEKILNVFGQKFVTTFLFQYVNLMLDRRV